MTRLFEQAIEKVKTLSDIQQDVIANIIFEEIEDDIRWDKSFACSQNILAMLAEEAMEEFYAGKTEELNPETL